MNLRWLAALAVLASAPALAQEPKDNIAGPYVPTPWVIVDAMLNLADIRADDVVYDLGSGDGRLVITAAKRYKARGVGVELQPELVEMANAGAKKEAVADRVKFIQGDLFETDIRDATVVTLYLLPRFVTRLVPRFMAELRPGTRIVSHDYPLAPWKPDKDVSMDVPEKEFISGTTWTRLYYYVVPARIRGEWELVLPKQLARGPLSLEVNQEPHTVGGLVSDGRSEDYLRDMQVLGEKVSFGLVYNGRTMAFEGKAAGDTMSGEVSAKGVKGSWTARRRSAAPK
ncbi:MAG TPA: methyltransferase domain-containing protein [Burkholderiales bacterium]|jgi:SAM-dependent methyltransferase|nr:methyltransferase domain-containing protein [Burkholderiales bacterium]